MPLHVLLLGVSIIKISRFCQNSSLQPKQSSVHPGGALFFEEIFGSRPNTAYFSDSAITFFSSSGTQIALDQLLGKGISSMNDRCHFWSAIKSHPFFMDACMITGILCGDLIQSHFFHLYEIHEPDMAYRTGTVINIVICNYDLLAGV